MKKAVLIFLLALLSNLSFAQKSAELKILIPAEYYKQITAEEVQLIDVRTPEEFEAGHIEGAKNIDFFSEEFPAAFEKLDRTKPLYIYCRSGNRSQKAAAKLSEMGFVTIIDLEGGFKAWTAEGRN